MSRRRGSRRACLSGHARLPVRSGRDTEETARSRASVCPGARPMFGVLHQPEADELGRSFKTRRLVVHKTHVGVLAKPLSIPSILSSPVVVFAPGRLLNRS